MIHFWAIVIVCAIYLAFMMFKMRVDTSWQEVADHFGLEYSGGGLDNPRLVGEVQGVSVAIQVHSVQSRWGRRSDKTHWTELNAKLARPWNCQTQITKRGFTDKVAGLVGGEDIEIGDEEFDKEFRIQGHVSDEIGDVLMKEQVQSGLRRLASTFYILNVQRGVIRVRNEGRVANPNKLIRQITALVDVARELNAGIGAPNAPAPPPLPEDVTRGDLFPDPNAAPPADTHREEQQQEQAPQGPTISELYSEVYSETFDVSPDDGLRDAPEKGLESDTESIW